VSAENGNVEMFGTKVKDMQSRVKIEEGSGDGAITGTLKYLDSGALVDTYGAGNFLALKFSDIPETATSVKVGLEPSQGTGLVEIINDPDKNGAFKITDRFAQNFKIVTTDGTNTTTQIFDLSRLNVQEG
jgi:hypothetical protein